MANSSPKKIPAFAHELKPQSNDELIPVIFGDFRVLVAYSIWTQNFTGNFLAV